MQYRYFIICLLSEDVQQPHFQLESNPANIGWPCRRLQHVFSITILRLPRRLKDVLKKSWKTKNCYAADVLKMSWRHVLKTCLEDLLKTCLEDVLKTCLEDVLKTCLEDVLKTCLEDVLKTYLEDALKTNYGDKKILTGMLNILGKILNPEITVFLENIGYLIRILSNH